MGKYDALDALPGPDAAAAPAAPTAVTPPVAAAGGKYALLDAPPASAPIDEPAGIGLSGPGSKDTDPTKLAPAEAVPRVVASESKVPGHQGEPERADSVVPELLSVLDGTKEGFKGLGRDVLSTNRQMSAAIMHPVDTLGDVRFRNEAMRGVNKIIMPVAGNKLVAAIGGPPEESASDRAAFPDAQAFGSMAGAFVPVPYGEIAAALTKSGKKAVGGLLGAVEKAGAGAEERNVARAVEKIEEGAGKKARLGLKESKDEVVGLARDNPEIIAHAGNDEALAVDAEKISKRAFAKSKDEYRARDLEDRKPVATDIISKAEQEEERASAARAEAQANPAGSGAREKAEKEASEAQARADQLRRDAAKKISTTRVNGADPSDVVKNMDSSVSRLRRDGSTSEERATADALEKIRNEFASAHGAEAGAVKVVPAEALRAQQTVYQKAGYAKVMPGVKDADIANAQILASRQASKDVGDAIYRHMGYDGYAGAVKAAEADPTSRAARLLKLNGEIEGASRIQAAIASKKARSHSGVANFMNLIFHGKAHAGTAGTLSAASLLAHEAGLSSVGNALGAAAGVVTAAPHVAAVADKALAATGRAAGVANAAITPAVVSELIDLARSPAVSYRDVLLAAEKRNVPAAIAARVAYEAGKAPPVATFVGPAMAEQQQEASP